MITVEDLLKDEAAPAPSRVSPSRTGSNSYRSPDMAVKFVSRDRLIASDGPNLADALYGTLAGRPPDDAERTILERLGQGGRAERRAGFEAILDRFDYRWVPLSGRAWLLDAASAHSLSVYDWCDFSVRFLWFKLRQRFGRGS